MNVRRTYLVAYDIRSPRRLARVCKVLSEIGYRLQYSVFAVDLDARGREGLAARLRRLIDPDADDVRFYLVPADPRGGWLGPVPGRAAIAVSGSAAATLADRLAARMGEI